MSRLALLDRDGTINVKAPEGAYVTSPQELVLLPGAAEAIRALNDAGAVVAIVTNQRGIARGLMSEADLDAVHVRLRELLDAAAGARVDLLLHCPHENGACDCRKPAPGMLLAAMDQTGIGAQDAVMIGDAASDVAAGRAAGVATIRIGADAPDLRAAVARWLRES